MITYDRSPFGINLLFRVHGSAVYRGAVLGLASVVILVLFSELWHKNEQDSNEFGHPLAIGVLVSTITFLLVFRVQQAYARYWEACSSVHHMMSKWMDATSHTGSYHMQCKHYDHIKPPSFFEYPELDAYFLSRAREFHMDEEADGSDVNSSRIGDRAKLKSIERIDSSTSGIKKALPRTASGSIFSRKARGSSAYADANPEILEGPPRLDGNWGALFDDGKSTYYNAHHPEHKDKKGFASTQGGRTPALFLQELAHLSSLLTGVALSTLRNDIEGAVSPLDIYEPGSPWPEVDPDKVKDMAFSSRTHAIWLRILNFFGFGRTPEQRTRYNASRPMPVVGGVSEAEIRYLQMARGPYAKTQLCWAWLSEFIIREHLAGTLGAVGPPIISRIIQFLGDGMIYYNHARKIMFVPFPFPHAQLSTIFVLIAVPAVASLMDQYVDDLWVGSLFAFLTVTALSGIHEVARELENPFRNVPNELPLVTLQAQYNEALMTLYIGYHPDHYWVEGANEVKRSIATAAGSKMSSNSSSDSMKKPSAQPEAAPSQLPTVREQIVDDSRIQDLIKKLEEQSLEIKRLRAAINLGDEAKLEPGDEKKLEPIVDTVSMNEDRKTR